RYLTELQGSVQGIDLKMVKKAPATVSFDERTLRLSATIWADLKTPYDFDRPAKVDLVVSETTKQSLPEGASLDYLWLVGSKDVWFRDLRQVSERPDTKRWYTIEKSIEDAPLTFGQAKGTKWTQAIVGIRTASGKLLFIRANLLQWAVF
ncbi:MAG TPA: hypothetical protein PLY73_14945, partial [Candidatus Ozemobacteraceae bacterium]|nr:hypothetical protein [Candidatus Ozemobacteraceae bacterium]